MEKTILTNMPKKKESAPFLEDPFPEGVLGVGVEGGGRKTILTNLPLLEVYMEDTE